MAHTPFLTSIGVSLTIYSIAGTWKFDFTLVGEEQSIKIAYVNHKWCFLFTYTPSTSISLYYVGQSPHQILIYRDRSVSLGRLSSNQFSNSGAWLTLESLFGIMWNLFRLHGHCIAFVETNSSFVFTPIKKTVFERFANPNMIIRVVVLTDQFLFWRIFSQAEDLIFFFERLGSPPGLNLRGANGVWVTILGLVFSKNWSI